MRYAIDGSIYQLDQKPDINYDVFCATQTEHREDEFTTFYGFNLFFVSRLDDTMENNRLQIQSQGKEVLSNIIRSFCYRFDIDIPTDIVYHPFTQRFSDECAGVYCSITLEIPVDWVCSEEYGQLTPIAPEGYELQRKTITIRNNGTLTVRPDSDFYGLSEVNITVNVEHTGRTTYYTDLHRVYDQLWDSTYAVCDYDYAREYFASRGPQLNMGACTSVRRGGAYGRNLDWYYDNEVEYIVRTQNTIGIAGGLRDLEIGFDPYDEAFHILPFYMQDAVNRHGVFANVNVVTIDSDFGRTTKTVPTVSKEDEICALMLVRYIVDNFETATEAVNYIQQHVSLYVPTALQEQGYELHFMIGDRSKTYALEMVNNTVVVVESDILTNFYLTDTTAETDGTFYSIKDNPYHNPMILNGLKKESAGVERYNLVLAGLNDNLTMRQIMNSVLYSKTYTMDEGDSFWYSEYVGEGLGMDNTVQDYVDNGRIGRLKAKWQNRDRNNPEVWHTTHSVVYDLYNLTLNVLSQESDSYDTELGGEVLGNTVITYSRTAPEETPHLFMDDYCALTDKGIAHVLSAEAGKIDFEGVVTMIGGAGTDARDVYEEVSAFFDQSTLRTIDLPDSIRFIGNGAFVNCTNLEHVHLPAALVSIECRTFKGCTSLSSISIPYNTKVIRTSAFEGCTGLGVVDLGDTQIERVGSFAFRGCTGMTELILPETLTQFGGYIFALTSEDPTSITTLRFLSTVPPTMVGTTDLPDTLEHIYVPAESVEAYRTKYGWTRYASIITANPK